jgi:hypothetical protein
MHYIDIDGTLTDKQKRWAKPIPARIDRVKAMIGAGMNVIIWSGTYRYARSWCDKYGFTGEHEPYAVLPKPNWMVDNQGPFGKVLGRRQIITPESWMEQTDELKRMD